MEKKKIIYSVISILLVFLFLMGGIFKNNVNANTNTNTNMYEPIANGDVINVTEFELKGE